MVKKNTKEVKVKDSKTSKITKNSIEKKSDNTKVENTKTCSTSGCKKNCCCLKVIAFLAIIAVLVISIFAITYISSINVKISKLDSFYTEKIPDYKEFTPNEKPKDMHVLFDGEPVIGDVNAPLTIYEFSDYECPFCGRFYSTTYMQIKKEYIDTGKVKLVFKDFPLGFHQNAIPAAASANCVFAQLGDEAYFKMHDIIFENQEMLSLENLDKWAVQLGVDKTKYDLCIKDENTLLEIKADLEEGQNLEISGTPSFVIGTELIIGAQGFDVFKKVIDSELEKLNN